jgi:hypothetical protein
MLSGGHIGPGVGSSGYFRKSPGGRRGGLPGGRGRIYIHVVNDMSFAIGIGLSDLVNDIEIRNDNIYCDISGGNSHIIQR